MCIQKNFVDQSTAIKYIKPCMLLIKSKILKINPSLLSKQNTFKEFPYLNYSNFSRQEKIMDTISKSFHPLERKNMMKCNKS